MLRRAAGFAVIRRSAHFTFGGFVTAGMLPQAPDWLIRRFAPRVVIDVAPEAFTFSRNGASRCLATYLYVRQREGLREIVAIGQDAPGSLGVVRIDLFAAGQSTVSDLNEHLEAYLTYGLQSLHTWSLIRPFVTVRGANRLAAFLSGIRAGATARCPWARGVPPS